MDNNSDNSKDNPKIKKKYKAKLSEKGITIDFDREDIEQNLPHLAKELLDVPIDGKTFSLNKYQQELKENDEDYEDDAENEDLDSTYGSIDSNQDELDEIDEDFTHYQSNNLLKRSLPEMDNKGPQLNKRCNEIKQNDCENAKSTKDQIRLRVKSQYDESEELFQPKTEDFIRRCSTINEAEEIIKFQLKRGEITQEKSDELLKLCHEKGLEYFGTKKVWGYYEQKYRKNST